MVDMLTPSRRSWLMSQVKSKNSLAELKVRRLVHSLGMRFRLHQKSLPGTPDLVLASRRTVIFVNGCFWHRHPGCRKASIPRTRPEFWIEKFERNVARDRANRAKLVSLKWKVLVIWECETKDDQKLSRRLSRLFRT